MNQKDAEVIAKAIETAFLNYHRYRAEHVEAGLAADHVRNDVFKTLQEAVVGEGTPTQPAVVQKPTKQVKPAAETVAKTE